MKNSKNKIYVVDFLMSFIVVFGVVMFLPMLQHIQDIFNVSVSQISWIPNVGYLTMIMFAMLIGKFINRVGIRKLLIISLILWISGICIEIVALSSIKYYQFIGGRFIEGIGEAMIFPLLLSLNKAEIKESSDEKVGLSLIEFGAALGGLIAAIIAGKFVDSPKQFLIIPITIAALTLIYVIINIKEVAKKHEEIQAKETKVKESKKAYISLLLMIFMIQIVFSSIQVYLAYYMEIFSSVYLTGIILSIEQIMTAAGTIAPIFLLNRISFKGIRNLIVTAFLFGVGLLALQPSIYICIFAVSMIAFFVGLGFTTLNIYLSKVVSENASQKVSFYTSVRFSGGFVLSFLWGAIIQSYRAAGKGYGEIFKYLYTGSGIIVVLIFLAIILLQNKDINFSRQDQKCFN